MFRCLKDLRETLLIQWKTALSLLMISYLSVIAYSYGIPDLAIWVALLCGLYLSSGECDYKLDAAMLITAWWAGNITLVLGLNEIAPRPLGGDVGEVVMFGRSVSVLVIDYLVLAPFDFAALAFIWYVTKQNIQRLTIWHLTICGYLVSNLYAHFSSCYALYAGVDPTAVGSSYDSYMFTSFYACLILLLTGSLTDRWLKHGGSNLDLDFDVLAACRRNIPAFGRGGQI